MIIDLAFTAYNRVNYMQESVASWNQVRWLGEWDAYVYIEPSPVENHVAAAAQMLDTNVIVNFNGTKLGVLVNPWQALEYRFKDGADFVVMAEDDIVVSEDIMEYFDWASQRYAADPSVLAVNAFSQIGGGEANHVTLDQKFSPLVWGTWANRWDTILRDTWDKDYTSGKADGSEAGWDWNINRILKDRGMYVVKPLQSRSDHIGKYAGTHMTPDLFDSSRGVDFKQTRGHQSYLQV